MKAIIAGTMGRRASGNLLTRSSIHAKLQVMQARAMNAMSLRMSIVLFLSGVWLRRPRARKALSSPVRARGALGWGWVPEGGQASPRAHCRPVERGRAATMVADR